jgi:hypothetical protein
MGIIMIKVTEEEIQEQIDKSYESDMHGMSYEEGVRYALEWILGSEDKPIED